MNRRKVLFMNFNSIKAVSKNIAVVLLFVIAFLLVFISKKGNTFLQTADENALKYISPAVHVLTLPADGIHKAYNVLKEISDIYAENEKLRRENRELLLQKHKYAALRAENALLARLLKYGKQEDADFITAKIVGEENSGFSHSLLAYIGDSKKVKRGQVVINENGVVGRVERVGGKYARIMLITDINSKIPIIIERNRVRGILSGENSSIGKIIFAPLNADIKEGDKVVTSGVAGVFPTGLEIGEVVKTDNGRIEVKPFADMGKLEYIKIVDYGFAIDSLEQ